MGWNPDWLSLDTDEELQAQSWGETVLLGIHGLILLGLVSVVVAGPPPVMLVPSPAPVQLRAFLFFKLLYLNYWKTIYAFVQTANLAGTARPLTGPPS